MEKRLTRLLGDLVAINSINATLSGGPGEGEIAHFICRHLERLGLEAKLFSVAAARASVVGRVITGTTAGSLIEMMGYVQFYLLTTGVALPGVLLYRFMLRAGLIEQSLGDAGYSGADKGPDQ